MKIWILTVACGVTMFISNPVIAQGSARTEIPDVLGASANVQGNPIANALKVDIPHFNDWDKYKVDPFIRAAAALQALGQEQAVQALLARANDRTNGFEVFVLCRMLFTPIVSHGPGKRMTTFRRPELGGAAFIGNARSSPHEGDKYYTEWPLEPIELVDGIPFLVTRGYTLAGEAETPEMYVKYCSQNCAWNTVPFKQKSGQEKTTALAKLISSHKLTPVSNRYELEFLSSQIK